MDIHSNWAETCFLAATTYLMVFISLAVWGRENLLAVTVIPQASSTQWEAKHPHALWKTSQTLPAYSKSLCMQGKGQNTEHRHMCQQGLLQPLAQQVQRATLCHPPRAKVQCVTAGPAPSPWRCPSTEHICSTCKGESPLYTVLIFHRDVVIQQQPHGIHTPCARSPVQGTPVCLEGKDRGREGWWMHSVCVHQPFWRPKYPWLSMEPEFLTLCRVFFGCSSLSLLSCQADRC